MATKLREVKIEEYWPLIVKNTAEFGQIAVAENPEFNNLAECIYRVLCDSFIDADMTEYGVSRWEKMLGITPAEGLSLDDRKAAILTQLSVKIPYTWRVLKQMLVPILGGEDKFVMEYVNDEGKLVVHTDRLDDAMLATVDELLARVLPQNIELVQYNHNMEISWRDINKYAECTSIAEIKAINPDFANDLTSDKEWIYPLPKLKDISNPENTIPRWPNGVKVWKSDLPSLTSVGVMFKGNSTLIEFHGDLPAVRGGGYEQTFESKVFRKFVGALSNLTNGSQFFWYCPAMEDFVSDLSRLSKGQYMFINTKLNKESALHVFNSIPAYTSGSHPLTIGIHIDHQQDEEVLAAIANAEAKGWTLTVQWNGTPTSAASVMRFGQLIYAKVGEGRDGERVLDWGHYVTNWEERGYEQFRSLESAYEYFNLEMPENE